MAGFHETSITVNHSNFSKIQDSSFPNLTYLQAVNTVLLWCVNVGVHLFVLGSTSQKQWDVLLSVSRCYLSEKPLVFKNYYTQQASKEYSLDAV